MTAAIVAEWIAGVVARHRAPFTTSEFTRAVRALSARYVEQRHALPSRSPLDSAGKRAAFAAFYAPLHFLTVERIVATLELGARPIDRLVDLGCGTGVASAAWARVLNAPRLDGIDANRWALEDARWNWRRLGVRGRAHRGDLVDALRRLDRVDRATGLVAAWSLNELEPPARDEARRLLLAHAARGAAVLVIEPLAHSAAPWWDEWIADVTAAGGRSDVWKFDVELPAPLAAIDEAAGFARESLGARSALIARDIA